MAKYIQHIKDTLRTSYYSLTYLRDNFIWTNSTCQEDFVYVISHRASSTHLFPFAGCVIQELLTNTSYQIHTMKVTL